MNKLTKTVLLILFLLVMASQTFGAPNQPGVISVTGVASGNFVPDTARLVLSVETMDKDIDIATTQNAKLAGKVLEAVKAKLKKAGEDSVSTSQYLVEPVYEYINSVKVFKGYRVVNQVIIVTDQIEMIGEIIDSAIKNGANKVEKLAFSLKKKDKVCNELLKEAARNAKEQASALAEGLGMKITGIRNITSACGETNPIPTYKGMAGERSTPIESGENEVSARVGIDFFIE